MTSLVASLTLLQLILPLVLIALNAVMMPASLWGFWLRFVGIFAILVYLRLCGVWLFPPWWTPYALGLLHSAGSIAAWVRFHRHASRRIHVGDGQSMQQRPPALASRMRAAVEIIVAATLFVAATVLGIPAIIGRAAPIDIVALDSPLEAGTYLVTSGGTRSAVNNHLMTLAEEERFKAYRGQSYAVDLVGIDAWGLHARSGLAPEEPKAYVIHGKKVLAPCKGTVVTSIDGLPDMPVPQMDREHMAGNHLIINCSADTIKRPRGGDSRSSEEYGIQTVAQYTVVLAHLAPGSINVEIGDTVDAGDVIGRVGNSGNTASPHLHIHVQSQLGTEQPLSAEPLWFTLDGRFLVRNDRYVVGP